MKDWVTATQLPFGAARSKWRRLALFDQFSVRVLGTALDSAWTAQIPEATLLTFDLVRHDGVMVSDAERAANVAHLEARKGSLDAAMQSIGFPFVRIRGPFPSATGTLSSACACAKENRAEPVHLGSPVYGAAHPSATATSGALSVLLTDFPYPVLVGPAVGVDATIRQEDCCGIDWQVSGGGGGGQGRRPSRCHGALRAVACASGCLSGAGSHAIAIGY